jgi:hypothetical protein
MNEITITTSQIFTFGFMSAMPPNDPKLSHAPRKSNNNLTPPVNPKASNALATAI